MDTNDFISHSTTPGGSIRFFTEDGKFISQDCYHLTQAGAKWFADKIDWSNYITIK